MDEYILLITLIGVAAFGMAWMPAITKLTGISYAIIYVLAGIAVFAIVPGWLPVPDVKKNEELVVRLSEMVVIISLMGTGIKIDRAFSFKNWSSPIRLVSIAMLLCIALATLLGYTLLGFDIASALLLGAALAPTDPVLASDVQVGPPNAGKKSETKFSLTAEAGLNDGMAFPFTWLAITLSSIAHGHIGNDGLWSWFGYHFLYKLIFGAAVGYLAGRLVGYLVFRLGEKYSVLKTRDGFLAVSLTLMVYGFTELIHAYGFIAVFICAITFRHFEKKHDYHDDLHSFTDQAERLLVAVVLILFGGSLASGVLEALTLKMALFTVMLVFIIRPIAAYASIFSSEIHIKEKFAISFFGIRGIGSIFYLAFAFRQIPFLHEKELWAIVAFTILISVLIHGITATPVMIHLDKKIPREEVPE
ncbi:cation:proton antiporter [Pedobacter sp. P351]|uniref:cation:proton antiporter n=1 Tax=Pedobacter superstes TaxID=3133441 RepID=UPI0030B60150